MPAHTACPSARAHAPPRRGHGPARRAAYPARRTPTHTSHLPRVPTQPLSLRHAHASSARPARSPAPSGVSPPPGVRGPPCALPRHAAPPRAPPPALRAPLAGPDLHPRRARPRRRRRPLPPRHRHVGASARPAPHYNSRHPPRGGRTTAPGMRRAEAGRPPQFPAPGPLRRPRRPPPSESECPASQRPA